MSRPEERKMPTPAILLLVLFSFPTMKEIQKENPALNNDE
jgi:hypothetical protein